MTPDPYTREAIEARTLRFATKAEWVAARAGWCGASEAAQALGLGHFGTLAEWVQQKKHPDTVPPLTGEWLDWGNWLEPAILDRAQQDHGPLQRRGLASTALPGDDLIRVTPDGVGWCDTETRKREHPTIVVDAKNIGGRRIWRGDTRWGVESKSRSMFGEPGTDEIPADYACSALLSCEAFGVDRVVFAVLVGGQEYREYVVERDSETAASIVAGVHEAWERYVVGDELPPADDEGGLGRLIAARHPRDVAVPLEPCVETRSLARAYLAAEATIEALANKKRRAEARKARAADELKSWVLDAEGIDGICTWRADVNGRRRFRLTYTEE